MILHHHTEGSESYRRFSSWRDIIQMNSHWNSVPFLWLWAGPKQSNPTFSQDNPPYIIKPSLVAKGSAIQIICQKSHIFIISSFTVTLTLKTANQSCWKTTWIIWRITVPTLIVKDSAIQKISSGQTFIDILKFLHKRLWLMIMYYQTKFSSKRISSSTDTKEIVIIWSYELLHWPFFLSVFLHDTPSYNDASQHQVWKQNVWGFRRYHLDKHLHFDPLLWPWPWMQLSNFFHTSLWFLMMHHQTKFGYQAINSSEIIAESHISVIWALAVTLTLKIPKTKQKKVFCMTLWLTILHHHINFGNQMFCDSENIQTSIHWHFEPSL